LWHGFGWWFLFLFLQRKDDQEGNDADADGAIGDVEGGPVVAADVKIEKVDDFAVS